jgi:hypothetical protein
MNFKFERLARFTTTYVMTKGLEGLFNNLQILRKRSHEKVMTQLVAKEKRGLKCQTFFFKNELILVSHNIPYFK